METITMSARRENDRPSAEKRDEPFEFPVSHCCYAHDWVYFKTPVHPYDYSEDWDLEEEWKRRGGKR